MQDHYKKLQVDPQADSEVIRAAYHALARKYHPDAGGDVRHMVEFNDAWAVLSNPGLRAAYDIERTQVVAPPQPETAHPLGRRNAEAVRAAESGLPARGAHDTSSILDFGRYSGWSVAQVVKSDPDYLEWLVRTAIGRRLTGEVKALLDTRAAAFSPSGAGLPGAAAGRGWFGRAKPAR
jgi:curved DNA-binding protein CbpA